MFAQLKYGSALTTLNYVMILQDNQDYFLIIKKYYTFSSPTYNIKLQ